jgi:hypothetical protein
LHAVAERLDGPRYALALIVIHQPNMASIPLAFLHKFNVKKHQPLISLDLSDSAGSPFIDCSLDFLDYAPTVRQVGL